MSLEVDIEVRVGEMVVAAALGAAPGEAVAVVGPNGAGKTSLLRAVAGLIPAVSGVVRAGDQVWLGPSTNRPTEARDLAMVFADGALFPHLSARDNVAFGVQARTRCPRRQARDRAGSWLERVGVAAVADQRPARLSSGQARRVALARALAVEPAVLLLDEPLTSLDLETAASVRHDLAEHLRGFGGVAVVVTHDPVDAAALAATVAVMEGGRLTQTGRLDEIAARPRSRYAARWVGLNLLEGSARDGIVELAGGGHLSVVGAPDGPVLVAVHPASVVLHRSRPEGSARNAWPATVEGIDADGARLRVRLAGALPLVAEITRGAGEELGLVPGAQVWAAVKATDVDAYPA